MASELSFPAFDWARRPRGATGVERPPARTVGLGRGVVVLRSLPAPAGLDTIEEVVVGEGGVTVVHEEPGEGHVRVRRGHLIVDGEDRSVLAARPMRELEAVCRALVDAGLGEVDVKAAVCFTAARGRALGGSPSIGGVRVCDPAGLAALVRRRGARGPVDTGLVADALEIELTLSAAA